MERIIIIILALLALIGLLVVGGFMLALAFEICSICFKNLTYYLSEYKNEKYEIKFIRENLEYILEYKPEGDKGKGENEMSVKTTYNDLGQLIITANGSKKIYESDIAIYKENVKEIIIKKSITSIEDKTLWGCEKLETITFGNSIKNIQKREFVFCSSLTNIFVDDENPYFSSQDGVLFNKDKTELICYPMAKDSFNYTIPSTVTAINIRAFYGCTNLRNVIIPSSVTSIEFSAFSYCTNLNNVKMPSSIKSISDHTFDNCFNLTNITIPSSVVKIGHFAFYGCENLNDINYDATTSQWNLISIGVENDCLKSANINCCELEKL